MIYSKKYLIVKLLIENLSKYELMGIYRPQAYCKGAKGYSSECQVELFKKPIEPGKSEVLKAVLVNPVGFGEHLHEGSLLTLRNGIDVEAKAIVLEIIGYKN
ncbi:MAG: hypothetical protein K0S44_606 [Bacteroidetes bacterium]|nr:hypothetical protein [Bacteroidota bacterium]